MCGASTSRAISGICISIPVVLPISRPMFFLAPAIVGGMITLGVMQQIIRAFGRVEGSMQYLFRSWPTIVELASVYKRLREFEKAINANIEAERTGSTTAS